MSTVFVPHKAARIGIALQTAKGTAAAQPKVVFPVNNGMERVWNQDNQFFQYADGVYSGPTHTFSAGEWLTAKARIPLVPGMLKNDAPLDWSAPGDDVGDIGDWMLAREVIGSYYQAPYATLFVDTGLNSVLYADVKCITGEIDVSAKEIVYIDVDTVGCGTAAAWTPTAADGTTGWATDATSVTVDPYTFDDASVSIAGASEASMHSIKLAFDNVVRDVGDSIVLGSLYPQYLPNAELPRWTGSFDRDYTDTTVQLAYRNKTEFELVVALNNGTVTATFTFPRTRITEKGEPDIPDSGILTQDGVAFQCLGAANGSARAYTVAETTNP